MIALALKPWIKWARTFLALLLIWLLLPGSAALAMPAAQDRNPYAKYLIDKPTPDQNHSAAEGLVSASDLNSNQIMTGLADGNSLQDPSFENSLVSNAYWQQYSTNFPSLGLVCAVGFCNSNQTALPNTGNNWVWFGGIDFTEPGAVSPEVGDIYQYAAFPGASCKATLQFYFWIGAVEPGSDANDQFLAVVDGQPVFSANATQGGSYPSYQLVSVDVSRFADGAAHKIEFYSVISNQFVTFNLDDVVLVSGPCTSTGKAVRGDYNGDHRKDVAIFRPSNSTWYIRGVGDFVYGTVNDIPVSGDYDGNGVIDIAIFRPSTSQWYIRGIGDFLYGAPGDIPVVGDYNGDGKDDIAIFRPSNSTWYVRGVGDFLYGAPGDIPVVADYNGDGKDDIAIFRPSTSRWYIRGVGDFLYGAPGDIPVIADYNGDTKADIAVFRPSNSTWYIYGVGEFLYGAPGDTPVVGDYNGDGRADIAVFRASNSTWYIYGIGDFIYGTVGDIPV